MTENNPQSPPPEEKPEDLFETRSVFQRPAFWFAVLMVPVVAGLYSSLRAGGGIQQPAAVPAPRLERPHYTPPEGAVPLERDGSPLRKGRRAESRKEAKTPLSTDCKFGFLKGQRMTEELYKRIGELGRPVFLFEEAGQESPSREPLRINIYISPQKTITRIECG